eukprot:4275134-Amphidinium_carterae.2
MQKTWQGTDGPKQNQDWGSFGGEGRAKRNPITTTLLERPNHMRQALSMRWPKQTDATQALRLMIVLIASSPIIEHMSSCGHSCILHVAADGWSTQVRRDAQVSLRLPESKIGPAKTNMSPNSA